MCTECLKKCAVYLFSSLYKVYESWQPIALHRLHDILMSSISAHTRPIASGMAQAFPKTSPKAGVGAHRPHHHARHESFASGGSSAATGDASHLNPGNFRTPMGGGGVLPGSAAPPYHRLSLRLPKVDTGWRRGRCLVRIPGPATAPPNGALLLRRPLSRRHDRRLRGPGVDLAVLCGFCVT